MTTVLGIDVGGTAIKAARFVRDAVDEQITAATPGDDVVGAVVTVAAKLMTSEVRAVGVAVPGLVVDGVVRYSTNVPWADAPLRDELAATLGVPVVVGNDVNAAALVESGSGDLLYVALGTGVGGAIVSDGRVVPGELGLAGEIGHLPVWPDGELCDCGQRGCLEAYASGRAIARRAGAASAEEVVARMTDDPAARTAWTDATTALGIALAAATLLLDPARIVLGGGVAVAGAPLLDPVRAELARRLTWRPAPPVDLARDPAAAGMHGAARLARSLTDGATR